MRKHLTLLFAALGFVAIYGLVVTSDIDDLGLTAQAVREQADQLQTLVDPDGAYIPYSAIPTTGGNYVSSRL